MYTRKEIIDEIKSVYEDLNLYQNELISARLAKDHKREMKALHELERQVVGVQQDLTVIYNYLNEHYNWQEIRRIVKIADNLIHLASDHGWTREEYYSEILRQYEHNEKDSKA
jgi:hypothetical protein